MPGLFWSAYGNPSSSAYAQATASQANSTAREAQESSKDAEERIDQLLLVTAALWELVRDKTGLTEDELIAKVAEVDARDGSADGKITHAPQKCPNCQRTIFPKHRRCLYCGATAPVDSVFKTI